MKAVDVVVISFCLVAGYWLVAVLLPLLSRQQHPYHERPPQPEPTPDAPPPWHAVLGVDAGAGRDEIVAAYRRRIGEYHPDKVAHLGAELRALAERRSREINEAYDAALRAQPR